MRGLPTSCTTLATDGMVVHTETPAVEQSRRVTMELIMANHHGDCLSLRPEPELRAAEGGPLRRRGRGALRAAAQEHASGPHRRQQPRLRPGHEQVHPLRPLRARLPRSHRHRRHRHRLPRQRRHGQHVRGQADPAVPLRDLRRVREPLSDRRAGLPEQPPGHPRGQDHLPLLRRRAARCTWAFAATRSSACGPTRKARPTRGTSASRDASASPTSSTTRRAQDPAHQEERRVRGSHLGRGARPGGEQVQDLHARGDRRGLLGAQPPTRTTTSCRSSAGRCWAPTTSTTAPASDTLPRWPVWPPRSAAAR